MKVMKYEEYDEGIEQLMYELIEKMMEEYDLEEEEVIKILKEYFQPPQTSAFSFIVR